MTSLKFSVLIPVYNGGKTIQETIASILSQSFTDFELIVQDNASTDDTADIVKSFRDPRVKYFKNDENLGYSRNLRAGKKNCSGDILYLMAADDILLEDALLNAHRAFMLDKEVGAVIRPYYWFTDGSRAPVRVTKRMNPHKDERISILDDFSRIRYVVDNEILGQLSGLAFRMKFIDIDFSEDPWISHGYPLVAIFKKHPVVFLKDHQVAVRIGFNETRKKSSLYDRSPMLRWIELFNTVFHEPELAPIRDRCIREIVAKNYVGLVQIRNFGKYGALMREIGYLLKYRWQNIFSPSCWFFSLGTLIVPSSILLPLVEWYKNVLSVNRIKLEGN